MAVMPAIRAPPFSVCNGRFSAAGHSVFAASLRQAASCDSHTSSSSVASSVKMLAHPIEIRDRLLLRRQVHLRIHCRAFRLGSRAGPLIGWN